MVYALCLRNYSMGMYYLDLKMTTKSTRRFTDRRVTLRDVLQTRRSVLLPQIVPEAVCPSPFSEPTSRAMVLTLLICDVFSSEPQILFSVLAIPMSRLFE